VKWEILTKFGSGKPQRKSPGGLKRRIIKTKTYVRYMGYEVRGWGWGGGTGPIWLKMFCGSGLVWKGKYKITEQLQISPCSETTCCHSHTCATYLHIP